MPILHMVFHQVKILYTLTGFPASWHRRNLNSLARTYYVSRITLEIVLQNGKRLNSYLYLNHQHSGLCWSIKLSQWKVESSLFGWRNSINMLPIITQNGHTIHAIFDFLLINHTTLCSNIQQSTFPHQPTKTGLSIVLKSKIS